MELEIGVLQQKDPVDSVNWFLGGWTNTGVHKWQRHRCPILGLWAFFYQWRRLEVQAPDAQGELVWWTLSKHIGSDGQFLESTSSVRTSGKVELAEMFGSSNTGPVLIWEWVGRSG